MDIKDVVIPAEKIQHIIDSEWYKKASGNVGETCEHSTKGQKPIKTKPCPPEFYTIADDQELLVAATLYLKHKLESKADQFWAGLMTEGVIGADEHWHYNAQTKELELYE